MNQKQELVAKLTATLIAGELSNPQIVQRGMEHVYDPSRMYNLAKSIITRVKNDPDLQ